MSPPQQPTSIKPNSLKIQLAYRFLHNLNTLNPKRSNLDHTQIHKRSNRVKIAAYSSMAHVVGSRRAWSRAILWKIRTRGVLARIKRVDHKITTRPPRHHLRHHRVHAKRRISKYSNYKREYVDPFGNLGQEMKLRKLVPGASTMDELGLLDETADYIKCLATQVEVMKKFVDLYSTI